MRVSSTFGGASWTGPLTSKDDNTALPLSLLLTESRRRKDKGRVVRGLCCSEGGVSKPDERVTRGSLAKCSRSVNAEAARCGEAYLPQLLIIDVPNPVFTTSDACAIKPCDRYGSHQVALGPHRWARRERSARQAVMKGANRIRRRCT